MRIILIKLLPWLPEMKGASMPADAPASLFDEPAINIKPELLVSAVLHLMSHYAANANESGPCLKLGSNI
jgi:hypothetical protein